MRFWCVKFLAQKSGRVNFFDKSQVCRVILVMCVTHLTNTFVLPKVTSLRNWRSSSNTLFIEMTDKNVVLHV